MIFPKLIQEDIVQVEDMTRFDMSKSFATPDSGPITAVSITFNQVDYFDVFVENIPEKWFFDYAFVDSGEKKDIWVKVATATEEKESNFKIDVLTKEEDSLFSTDSMIFSEETEMKKFIPKGRTSFNYAHRVAQRNIIRYLDGEGLRNVYGVAFTKSDLINNEYIKEFSIYETMMLIFEDLRVKGSDVFKEKKSAYESKYIAARKNAVLRLDYNADGETEPTETKNVQMKFLGR